MNQSDKVVHAKLEIQQSQNAEAIGALTKTVDALAKTIGDESKANSALIHELRQTSLECSIKFEHLVEGLDSKKERLDKLESEIQKRASKVLVHSLVNRLWKIGGAVVMILIAALGFMIKMKLGGN